MISKIDKWESIQLFSLPFLQTGRHNYRLIEDRGIGGGFEIWVFIGILVVLFLIARIFTDDDEKALVGCGWLFVILFLIVYIKATCS